MMVPNKLYHPVTQPNHLPQEGHLRLSTIVEVFAPRGCCEIPCLKGTTQSMATLDRRNHEDHSSIWGVSLNGGTPKTPQNDQF